MSSSSASASTTPSRTIWNACRRGDTAFVHEYIAQSKGEAGDEEEDRSGTTFARSAGGGVSSSSASSSTSSSASSKKAHVRTRPHPPASASNHHSSHLDSLQQVNSVGLTPLHVATIHQHRSLVASLLDAGASPLVKDRESGWTPLAHALYRGDITTASILLRHQAGIADTLTRTLDDDQQSAFDLVCQHIHAVRRGHRRENRRIDAAQQQRVQLHSAATNSNEFSALHQIEQRESDEIVHRMLYSFGYQSQYTLGYAVEHFQRRAKLLATLPSVIQVLTFKQAVFTLGTDGNVYSQGQGKSGKLSLGHEAKETLIEPRQISALTNITHIAGTDEYVLCCNSLGHVYGFGSLPAFLANDVPSSSTSTAAPIHIQTPRRLEVFKNFTISHLYPASSRVFFIANGELFFCGHSLEDLDRFEPMPKRFTLPNNSQQSLLNGLQSIDHRDEFLAILSNGVIRLQRRGEKIPKKIWLQNYHADPTTIEKRREVDKCKDKERLDASSGVKLLRDLFPLIPTAYITKMSWTSDGRRGACVTKQGQLFIWKLQHPERSAKSSSSTNSSSSSIPTSSPPPITSQQYPRCIGYLVDGLSRVRVTDVSITAGHTTVLTDQGHVYTFGPSCLGFDTPSLRPKRILHLSQVAKIYAAEQYMFLEVDITQPLIDASFPEMAVYRVHHHTPAAVSHVVDVTSPSHFELVVERPSVEIPSLRLLCEHQLAQQITPLSVLSAYSYAFNTHTTHLLHYCASFLLANLPFYLPQLLNVATIESLHYLQERYAETYPLPFVSHSFKQPLLPDDAFSSFMSEDPTAITSVDAFASAFRFPTMNDATTSSQVPTTPKTTEERVSEFKTRRRALLKKLSQIATLRSMSPSSLDHEQKNKIASEPKVTNDLRALEKEVELLKNSGSVSAAKLWDKIQGIVEPPTQREEERKKGEDERKEEGLSPTRREEEKKATEIARTEEKAQPAAAKEAAHNSRVASDLLARPVRTLSKDTPAASESKTPLQKPKSNISSAIASPLLTSTPVSTPMKPLPVAAVSWTASSPASKPAVAPIASSFAAIQAEEARRDAAANQISNNSAKKTTKNVSVDSTVHAIIKPGASKGGWGSTSSPPLGSSVPSATTASNDFPSLGAAALNRSSSAISSPAFKSTSPSLRPAISSPPLRSSSSSSSSAATNANNSQPTAFFSLADFMPQLPKPKSTPVKAWAAAPQPAAPADTTPQKQGKSAASNGKTPKSSNGATAATSTPASAAPVSLLSIQQAESIRCYGPDAEWKTQRQLEAELAMSMAAASVSKIAWNSMHVKPSHDSSSGLADVQSEEMQAIRAEEERIAKKLALKQKKKDKRLAAKQRDAVIEISLKEHQEEQKAAQSAIKKANNKPKQPKHVHVPINPNTPGAPQTQRQPQAQQQPQQQAQLPLHPQPHASHAHPPHQQHQQPQQKAKQLQQPKQQQVRKPQKPREKQPTASATQAAPLIEAKSAE